MAKLQEKTLTLLSNNKSTISTANSPFSDTSNDYAPPADLAAALNEQEKHKYIRLKQIGSGTYANVYKGHLRADPSSLVAIKKMKVQTDYKEGLSMDSIREIKFLQELSHPNIIALHSVFSSKDQNINLVIEFMPHGDLEMVIKDHDHVAYGLADVKAWMGMLGRATWFCHENFVLHRDIKPSNVLIAADGQLKLSDFGLARSFADPYQPMTHLVITNWYRPPELFYKAKYYSGVVDVWSCGCVLAQLVLRSAYIHGETDMQVLDAIVQALGQPTEENWPGVSKLENYVMMKPPTRPLTSKAEMMNLFGTLGPVGVDLLMAMLALDPRKRLTSKQVLEHEFFKIAPRPTKAADLPKKGGGEKQAAEDLKRKATLLGEGRGGKVAKKLDFGAARR
ncbi:Pkinase-domain-containing protein [Tothia fuscella]|uniref:Pkinase-domain-containing protein n=1 Tax=Tothia fuscella TaxID=1048955 RepID=A0A9P4NX65_9PEZI|nr:Pkinase-domain-containing protein [Tothia fuscella]